MKKLFTLSAFVLICSLNSMFAIEHVVTVASFQFAPTNLSVTVGDVITWQHVSGTHTTTSTSVPVGAQPWDSPINLSNLTFSYTVEEPGDYSFVCSIHSSMVGTFTAEDAVSVANLNADLQTNLEVQFVRNTLLVNYDLNAGGTIELKLFGLSGQLISNLKSTSLASGSYFEQFEMSNLPTGVYLVRMQAAGEVITKRIFVSQK